MTLCPSGEGDGLEIHWALAAGVRIPSVSLLLAALRHAEYRTSSTLPKYESRRAQTQSMMFDPRSGAQLLSCILFGRVRDAASKV